MSLIPWEEHILIDEDNGIEEKENPLRNWSNNNGELEEIFIDIQSSKSGEEELLLPNEIIGSLVEDSTLLGLEENDHSIDGVLERENSKLFPPTSINVHNEEPSNSNKANAKKEEHNARERQRRLKLSHSYFSLRSLLPNARRSKVSIYFTFLFLLLLV